MTNLEVENHSKISLRSKQKLAKYIQFKNTLKTVLARSEAEIHQLLCFDLSKNLKCIHLGPWAS